MTEYDEPMRVNSRLKMTVHIVSSYVRANPVVHPELTLLIKSVYSAINSLDEQYASKNTTELPKTLVPIRKSVTPDYIISLEDGRPYKTLKRHLTARGLTPDAYRAKWGLPASYPLVAPNYSAKRASLAKEIGFGLQNTSGKRGRRKKVG